MERFTGTQEQFKNFEGKNIIITHMFTEKRVLIEKLNFEIYCQIGKHTLIELEV